MLHYTTSLTDGCIGHYASITVTGEPMEVALAACGLLGSNDMRKVAIQYGIDHDFEWHIPDCETINGIEPTNTMLIASVLARHSDYVFVLYTNPHDWTMFNDNNGVCNLHIESSIDETRRLVSVLTTDEGWYGSDFDPSLVNALTTDDVN